MDILALQLLLGIVFLTVVFLHISKKDFGAVIAYSIQSLAMVAILFFSFLQTHDISLLYIVAMTLLVKVVLAPIFFVRLVKKYALVFSVSTYLNTPLTLIIIAALTAIAHSQKLFSLTNIVPVNHAMLALALSTILLALFLIVNRRGALSQIIGILSFENGIVAFGIFAGLEQSFGLQMGIIFNILLWLIIATAFVSMLYKHFGSLNVTSMKQLTD